MGQWPAQSASHDSSSRLSSTSSMCLVCLLVDDGYRLKLKTPVASDFAAMAATLPRRCGVPPLYITTRYDTIIAMYVPTLLRGVCVVGCGCSRAEFQYGGHNTQFVSLGDERCETKNVFEIQDWACALLYVSHVI
eukprot:scaffold37689_cov49-Attheya_sp.AAC.3